MVSPSCTSPSTSVEAAVSREVLRKLRLALEGTDSDPLPTPRSFTDAISMMKAPYSPASASGPGKGAGEGGGGKMTRGGGLVRGLLNRLRFRGGGGGKSGKDHVKPAQPFPSMDSLANAAADDHHRKRDEPDASKPLLLPPRHRSDAAVEKKQMKEVADAPNASSQPEDEEALRARRRRVGGKKYEEAEAEDNREDDRGGRREAICREIFADITGLIDVRLLAKLTTLPPTSSSSPSSSSPPVKYYYEMLSSYYERNKEEGAEVANLCQVYLL